MSRVTWQSGDLNMGFPDPTIASGKQEINKGLVRQQNNNSYFRHESVQDILPEFNSSVDLRTRIEYIRIKQRS